MRQFECCRVLGILIALLAATSSSAEEITQVELDAGNVTVDFEALTLGLQSNPLVLVDVTISSSTFLRVNDISFTAADENHPTLMFGNILTTVDDPNFSGAHVPITIVFSQPVSEVGLGWWDPNSVGNQLEVYDANDNLLEQVSPIVWPPGGANASFVGIRRASREIAYAVVVPVSSGDWYGIDNLSFSAPPLVPLSSSAVRVLLLVSLVATGGFVGLRASKS